MLRKRQSRFNKKILIIVIIAGILAFLILSVFVFQYLKARQKKEDMLGQLQANYQTQINGLQENIDHISGETNLVLNNLEEHQAKIEEYTSEVTNKDEKFSSLGNEKAEYTQILSERRSQVESLNEELRRLAYDNAPKVIDVNLTTQTLVAYEYGKSVKTFIISSGAPTSYTIPGNFSITAKYPSLDYSGADYYYPDVHWNMRYYGAFLIHTAYWHDDFGTPVSHGCINMRESEAEWLYNWTPIGTPVKIHY